MVHLKTWCSYVFPKFSCVEPLSASSGQADQTQIATQTARGGEWKFPVDEWMWMNRWGCSRFWSNFSILVLILCQHGDVHIQCDIQRSFFKQDNLTQDTGGDTIDGKSSQQLVNLNGLGKLSKHLNMVSLSFTFCKGSGKPMRGQRSPVPF